MIFFYLTYIDQLSKTWRFKTTVSLLLPRMSTDRLTEHIGEDI